MHNEFFAPVLRLPVSDVDRRMLRQILNKLKGKHSRELDSADYIRIIEAGEKDDLKALLAAVGEKLPEELGGPREGSNMIPENYELVIDCKDEAEQKAKFEELAGKGWKVRVRLRFSIHHCQILSIFVRSCQIMNQPANPANPKQKKQPKHKEKDSPQTVYILLGYFRIF
jgi:hypothetical protein